jgi:hypothetical protein
MACGVPVSPTGKAIAKQKATLIELDISAGHDLEGYFENLAK